MGRAGTLARAALAATSTSKQRPRVQLALDTSRLRQWEEAALEVRTLPCVREKPEGQSSLVSLRRNAPGLDEIGYTEGSDKAFADCVGEKASDSEVDVWREGDDE